MERGYTHIPDWMLSLDLDVYETIILAVIFGFSQDGDSTFSGSQSYLAKKAKCSRRKVGMALPKLVKMDLVIKIDKEVRGVKLCEYKVTPKCMGCECDAQGTAGDAQGGYACDAHNNIEINNKDINKDNTLYKESTTKFQKPSLSEIRSYCQERQNNIDPEHFYNFYESKGWMVGKSKMKDWKASIRTWEQREKEIPQRKRESRGSSPKETVLSKNLKALDQMFGTNSHQQVYGNKKEDMIDEQ